MDGPKEGGVAGAHDFLESQLPQQLGTSRAFKKPRSSVGLLQPLGTSRTFKKLRSSAGFTPATEAITQFPRSLRGERSRDSVGFLQAHSLSSEGTQVALTSRLASSIHSNRASLHSRIAHRPQHARGECTPALRAHLACFWGPNRRAEERHAGLVLHLLVAVLRRSRGAAGPRPAAKITPKVGNSLIRVTPKV